MSNKAMNLEPDTPSGQPQIPEDQFDLGKEEVFVEFLKHLPHVISSLFTHGSPGGNINFSEDNTGVKVPLQKLIGKEYYNIREENFKILSALLDNIDSAKIIRASKNQLLITFKDVFHPSTGLDNYYVRIEFYNHGLPNRGIAVSLENKIDDLSKINSPEIPLRGLRNGLCHLESLNTIYFHKTNKVIPGNPEEYIDHLSRVLVKAFASNYYGLYDDASKAMLVKVMNNINSANNRPFPRLEIKLQDPLKGTWNTVERRITNLDLNMNQVNFENLKSILLTLAEQNWTEVSRVEVIQVAKFNFPYGEAFTAFMYRKPSKEVESANIAKRAGSLSWVRVSR